MIISKPFDDCLTRPSAIRYFVLGWPGWEGEGESYGQNGWRCRGYGRLYMLYKVRAYVLAAPYEAIRRVRRCTLVPHHPPHFHKIADTGTTSHPFLERITQ